MNSLELKFSVDFYDFFETSESFVDVGETKRLMGNTWQDGNKKSITFGYTKPPAHFPSKTRNKGKKMWRDSLEMSPTLTLKLPPPWSST